MCDSRAKNLNLLTFQDFCRSCSSARQALIAHCQLASNQSQKMSWLLEEYFRCNSIPHTHIQMMILHHCRYLRNQLNRSEIEGVLLLPHESKKLIAMKPNILQN